MVSPAVNGGVTLSAVSFGVTPPPRLREVNGGYMEFTNDIAAAERRLQDLIEDRERLQGALSKAVEDADAEAMLRHRRALGENTVRAYAERARVMRLNKLEDERARALVIHEREALEAALAEATRQYADAVSVADERRITMQTIQAKLFSIDSRAEILRQSINENTTALRQHVARWHTDALKAAGDDEACM